MRRAFYILAVILLSTELCAKEYLVHGPQGGLDTCPMVILMHGIFSSNQIVPIPALARELSKNGIASISFDFGGHWKSEGDMQHMTVGKEIGMLGHSQGGVVASMTAGILSSKGEEPAALVLVAPSSHFLAVRNLLNHMIRKLRAVVSHAVSFFVSQFI